MPTEAANFVSHSGIPAGVLDCRWWAMLESGVEVVNSLPRQLGIVPGAGAGAGPVVIRQAISNSEPPLYRITEGVARIHIAGVMVKPWRAWFDAVGLASSARTREAIRAAILDPEVKGIAIRIDSPGGTVSGTADLGDAVQSARGAKPVYTHIEDLGASAAYWVASQSDFISANRTAEIGSIGTMLVVHDISGLAAEMKIKVHAITSGGMKGKGAAGTEITEAQIDDWKREVMDLTEQFIGSVARGRNLTVSRVRELADGRVHIASKAADMNLIDAVQPFEQTIAAMHGAIAAREVKAPFAARNAAA